MVKFVGIATQNGTKQSPGKKCVILTISHIVLPLTRKGVVTVIVVSIVQNVCIKKRARLTDPLSPYTENLLVRTDPILLPHVKTTAR